MPMLTDIGLHHYGNTFNDAAGPVSRAASVLALGVTCTGLPGRVTLISSKNKKEKVTGHCRSPSAMACHISLMFFELRKTCTSRGLLVGAVVVSQHM